MGARTTAAVAAGRLAARVSQQLGRGGGTALPGLVAERADPAVVANLGRQLGGGAILITATNGKTTTARMTAEILRAGGVGVLQNREGSNLMRGLASTLVAESTLAGRLRDGDRRTGIFEVDEAVMPLATRALGPRVLAFGNLFRDQLDRYGEVDTVSVRWREALAAARPSATLVLNADDPSVAELGFEWPGAVHWYGIDDPALATEDSGAFDARWCRACGGSFRYERRYFAHVGLWRCSGCGRARPARDTTATAVQIRLAGASFHVPGLGDVRMTLTGLYNVYNALAAVSMARVLGIADGAIRGGLAATEAAFGRQEMIDLEGRRLEVLLAKNPAGANQVLRLLATAAAEAAAALDIAVVLNDRVADGQDVSWTWDVDYEQLAGSVGRCWAGGDRAEDMALRLKYAGWPAPQAVASNPDALLDAILAATPPGQSVFLCPTYTAMLDLRAALARRGAVTQFWEA